MACRPKNKACLDAPNEDSSVLRSEDPTQDCVAIAGRPQGTYSVMESTEAQSIRLRASSYRARLHRATGVHLPRAHCLESADVLQPKTGRATGLGGLLRSPAEGGPPRHFRL